MKRRSLHLGQLALWLALAAPLHCSAATLAPSGCPVFHCTAEATGVMPLAVVPHVSVVTRNNVLGKLKYQGCSGDGTRLACLFSSDRASGSARGTLKVLDATTLQPIWASVAAPNSYDPVAGTAANGQVPQMFADGSIAAGDASFHTLYNASGGVIGKLAVGGKGNNFGLTPISDSFGIVSQSDGVLTLVYLPSWQRLGVLALLDPKTGAPLRLVSPSSASSGVLYAVALNSLNNHGFLFAVAMGTTQSLAVRAVFTFVGRTQASPVVVAPGVSGRQGNLVLLNVPGLLGDQEPQNRLLGLVDKGSALSTRWKVPLASSLPVAPTVDQPSQSLFFGYGGDALIHQYSLDTGAPIDTFDLRSIGGLPPSFSLNGHLGSAQAGSQFTLLLSGSVTTPESNAEYALAFNPGPKPASMQWVKRISGRADGHTAAWNAAPSSQPTAFCPIVVGSVNGITRLCDF